MLALYINIYKRFSGTAGLSAAFVGCSHSEASAAGMPVIEVIATGVAHSESSGAGRSDSSGEARVGVSHSESSSTGVSDSINEKSGVAHSEAHSAAVNESSGIVIVIDGARRKGGGGFAHRYPNVAAADPARLAELKRENATLRQELDTLRAEMYLRTSGGHIDYESLSQEEQALIVLMLDDE